MKSLGTTESKEIREKVNELVKLLKKYRELTRKGKIEAPQANTWTVKALERLDTELGFWFV